MCTDRGKQAEDGGIASEQETFDQKLEQWHEEKTDYYFEKALECRKNKQFTDAVVYFLQAADRGHAEAMFELAMCYALGQGVEYNTLSDFNWTMRAAEQGLSKAVCMVGFHYEIGKAVSKDKKLAVAWYRRAAEMGDAEAMYSLARCYEGGVGVDADPDESARWMRMSAESGCERAADVINPPKQRYEWITDARDRRAGAADGWRIAVDVREEKEDHVYSDVYDEQWRKVYDLQLGLRFSQTSIHVFVSALLFENGGFAGAALKVSEPVGGLSLVVDETEKILLPGKAVRAGYHTGNDDFSLSFSLMLSLEKTTGDEYEPL